MLALLTAAPFLFALLAGPVHVPAPAAATDVLAMATGNSGKVYS